DRGAVRETLDTEEIGTPASKIGRRGCQPLTDGVARRPVAGLDNRVGDLEVAPLERADVRRDVEVSHRRLLAPVRNAAELDDAHQHQQDARTIDALLVRRVEAVPDG